MKEMNNCKSIDMEVVEQIEEFQLIEVLSILKSILHQLIQFVHEK
jgi:hypothetical protein